MVNEIWTLWSEVLFTIVFTESSTAMALILSIECLSVSLIQSRFFLFARFNSTIVAAILTIDT